MRRLPLFAAAFVAASVASVALTSTPAQAAVACPTNNFCMYQHAGFQGRYVFLTLGANDLDAQFNGFGDEMSSAINNTNFKWCVWDGRKYTSSYSGGKWGYDSGAQVSYVGDSKNDKVSSAHKNEFGYRC